MKMYLNQLYQSRKSIYKINLIMALHFTEQDFESRKNKIVKSMKEKNLDALLLFRQESMYWLTGYDTFGYVFFQCLVY